MIARFVGGRVEALPPLAAAEVAHRAPEVRDGLAELGVRPRGAAAAAADCCGGGADGGGGGLLGGGEPVVELPWRLQAHFPRGFFPIFLQGRHPFALCRSSVRIGIGFVEIPMDSRVDKLPRLLE